MNETMHSDQEQQNKTEVDPAIIAQLSQGQNELKEKQTQITEEQGHIKETQEYEDHELAKLQKRYDKLEARFQALVEYLASTHVYTESPELVEDEEEKEEE